MQEQKNLFPDLVAEEAKTGLPAGMPMVRESEVWDNPNMLLPERHELWWDDGTAEPEWFVDRSWPVSTSTAAIQLFGALTLVIGTGMTWAYYVNLPRMCGFAPADRWKHMPFDLSQEYGVANMYPSHHPAMLKEYRANGGAKGASAEEEDEEDEDEE